jgi:hypothetical protein
VKKCGRGFAMGARHSTRCPHCGHTLGDDSLQEQAMWYVVGTVIALIVCVILAANGVIDW